MLDHDRGWLVEVAHDGQRTVQVQEIVVRKFFAVELPCGDHTGPFVLGSRIDGRFLVRVLAVTQHLLPLET